MGKKNEFCLQEIKGRKAVTCIETHTEGEPTRTILSGFPEIPGNTMEKWEVISGGKAELTEENGTFSISVPIPERDSIDTILKLTFAEPIVWEGCKGRENDVYGLADGLKEE